MSNTISTLLKLPASLQTQSNVEAARQAYYDYLTASSETKAAAYDKAVKLLGESINAALESPSLDVGTRAALQTLLDNIDSGRSVGDNESIKFDIKEIASQLKTDKDTAYFWSGNSNGKGGKDFAMEYANKNGGITLEGLMDRKGIKMPIWDISNPNAIKAWDDASAEYAKQASGEVRAIIGTSIRPNSTWERIELPALKSNNKVTKIIIIDPETLIETVIFIRR